MLNQKFWSVWYIYTSCMCRLTRTVCELVDSFVDDVTDSCGDINQLV